jgi:hypothetical protein
VDLRGCGPRGGGARGEGDNFAAPAVLKSIRGSSNTGFWTKVYAEKSSERNEAAWTGWERRSEKRRERKWRKIRVIGK